MASVAAVFFPPGFTAPGDLWRVSGRPDCLMWQRGIDRREVRREATIMTGRAALWHWHVAYSTEVAIRERSGKAGSLPQAIAAAEIALALSPWDEDAG
jgi:hypothetical protein